MLDEDRSIDWSLAGIPGGIPQRTHVCATLDSHASAAQINQAIASCSGGVVQLNSGVYKLSSGITFGNRSGITLRGAGPEHTVLRFSGSAQCGGFRANVCLHGASTVWSGNVPSTNIRDWTAGYAKGGTVLTLSSTAGLAAGMVVALDQLEDKSDTGGILMSDAPGFTIEGGAPGRDGRPQQQFVEVTGVKGNHITISPGLYMPNWRGTQKPQVWWWGDRATTAVMNGIESLTIDSSSSNETSAIAFTNAYKGWVKNVKSLNPGRNHVWLNQCARIEVRDSYFFGTKNAASQSYGVELFTTSDALVINNIFHHVTSPIMMGPSAGSVVAYNFLYDMHYSVPTWMMAGLQGSHDAGTGMNLFEGNVANAFLMDLYHGTGSLATLFRNRLTGIEPEKMNAEPTGLWDRLRSRFLGNAGARSNTSVVNIWAFNRLVNVVGNVLGTGEYHDVYEHSPSSAAGSPDRAIYLLGYSGTRDSNTPGIPYDPRVSTTLLRWGNYDYATQQTRWNRAEIPAGHSVPRGVSLPVSLFLTSKPSWWGSSPWPAIGPDVTGGQDPAGHAHKIPAQVCFERSSRAQNGSISFDPAACYSPADRPE